MTTEINSTVTKIGTWLPVFPGFYGTLFDTNESEYRWVQALREAGKVPDDWELEFDYAAFTRAVCKEAVDWVEHCFTCKNDKWGRYANVEPSIPPSAFGITKVEFEKLVSPREYNFVNDAVNCEVTLDTAKFGAAFSRYVKENPTDWADHLRRHYKSRDGFCSFYPYEPEAWSAGTRDFTFPGDLDDLHHTFNRLDKLAAGDHALGRCLEFLLESALPDAGESLYYFVSERVYPDEFVTNYPEGIDLQDMNESFTL